jgi:hypothetical protein
MTKRADFNAEEWAAVVEGPMLAGTRVVTAARGGTLRETFAMGKTYAQARQQQGHSELLDALVSSPPAIDPGRLQSSGDLSKLTTERLGEATQILDHKASAEEVEAYKQFVVAVAEAAANAHREGSLMGVGGNQVSESEQAALDEIARSLQSG